MSYLDERRKFIEAGRPLPEKKKYQLKKVSDKRAAKIAAEKVERGDSETKLQKFFRRCIKQMTGRCSETGLPTARFPYHEAICSVCHILPQQSCKSVATHPAIWIELDKDFHKKFDAMSWKEKEKLKCWPVIRERLVMVYPDLAENERRHFPDSVLKWMKDKEPFVG